MSQPEVTAREARRVAEEARSSEFTHASFARELYLGRFRPEVLWPEPSESTPPADPRAEAFLTDLRHYLDEYVDGARIEAEDHIDDEVLAGLARIGAFGMTIPREYGGVALSHVDYNRALILAGSANPSLGALLSAHQSIGVPEPVKVFGTPEQKETYLRRCAEGAISAFLLTEPDVGSDPARLHASATRTPEGDYLIDGVKLWATNAVLAEVFVVMARVPPDPDGGGGGITAFIVEADTPGITIERRNEFMGLRGLENAVVRFHQVRVPARNVVGAEGKGLKIALTTLNTGRLSIPALCVAGSKWSLTIARQWARERVQWGAPIGKHAAIAHQVAFIAATTYAQEAVVQIAAELADAESADIRIEAALAKLWCSEMAWQVADAMVQIRGGRGYETARSLAARGERAVPAEQLLRDLRINRIFEGSSEIMHLLIAREAVDEHLRVAGALIDPDADSADRARAAADAAMFYGGWLPRLVAGPGDLPASFASYGPAAPALRYVERTSRRLARNTFYGMVRWQGGLEKRQGFLARVVDVGAELFAQTAVQAHAARTPEIGSRQRLADAFCRQSRVRVERLFRELWRNSDDGDEAVAAQVLAGDFSWAEDGVIDPSAGTGPWIATATEGPSTAENLARRYRR
ncbi:acyl-CoA dehydrogenase family protein [Ruania rhizosphaerae]|uniref:acyl-CoA dehydrogenase family protein n=1 Tax=Ruania rhizosphaerae TaxID=1840413 RepID=UPI00135889D3|nr:acyl-CoA dehydrogenase family protein [Ruania rhizosphaerae]